MECYAIQTPIKDSVDITPALLEKGMNPTLDAIFFRINKKLPEKDQATKAIEIAKGLLPEDAEEQYYIYKVEIHGTRKQTKIKLLNGKEYGGRIGHIYKMPPNSLEKFRLLECFPAEDPEAVYKFDVAMKPAVQVTTPDNSTAKPAEEIKSDNQSQNDTQKPISANVNETNKSRDAAELIAKRIQENKKTKDAVKAQNSDNQSPTEVIVPQQESPKTAASEQTTTTEATQQQVEQPGTTSEGKPAVVTEPALPTGYSFFTKVCFGAVGVGAIVTGGVWAFGALPIMAAAGVGALVAGITGLAGYFYHSWYAASDAYDHAKSIKELGIRSEHALLVNLNELLNTPELTQKSDAATPGQKVVVDGFTSHRSIQIQKPQQKAGAPGVVVNLETERLRRKVGSP